jgi:saccharopine dehydrogenase-like NADP-dependent oxidoreductase
MNEIGLDPGIDHMSAMKVIDAIKERWRNDSFESFCGGLVAPESDTNLWNYKFTWAPLWCLPVKVALPSLYRKERIHSVL